MRNAFAISVAVLVGCGSRVQAGGDPGFETGPCVEYQCLGGELVCLSNLCVDPNNMTGPDGETDSGDEQTSDPDTGIDPADRNREVDILFVIDNSGSMGEEQGLLASGLEGFIDALDSAEADWRIGITTTDNGNPWCGSTSPEAGKLVLSSCRGRTGQFVFNGDPPADATEVACTSLCALDEVEINPTTTEFDSVERPRPWIQRIDGETNLDAGVDVVEALQCVLPQGIAGCGFESHLESVYKTLLRSSNEDEEQYGFARSTAMLAIVIVSDENDCSYNPEFQSIFLAEADGGNPAAFWSDPDASAPTSAVCWNAGVACEGSGMPYDSCRSANKDVNGAVDVADDDAVMHPLSRFVDYFQEIEDARKESVPDRDVFVALIAGVTEEGVAIYADSTDPVEQGGFGIGPGCSIDDGDPMTRLATARPPVREREFAEAFTLDDEQNMFSICREELSTPLEAIAAQITSRLGPAE